MSRNLVAHPITIEEVKLALEHACMQENDDDRIGGLNGFILQRVWELADKVFTEEDFKI